MKKLLILFLLLGNLMIYSNDLINKVYYSHFLTIRFTENTFNLKGMDLEKEKRIDIEYNYKLISEENSVFMLFGDNYKNKWLLLYNNEIFIAFDKNKVTPTFLGYFEDAAAPPFISIGSDENMIHSTSHLEEGSIRYIADNLRSLKVDTPWVEGVEKFGIGEKIFLPKSSISNLVIINGFISFRNPWLYIKNSRVKKVKITDSINNIEKIFELKDTMNPQVLSIGDYKYREIIIEILEIYKGSRYDDTCIAGLFSLIKTP